MKDLEDYIFSHAKCLSDEVYLQIPLPLNVNMMKGIDIMDDAGYKIERIRSSLYSVNTAFSILRTLIPTEPADRKLSKIETLRLASSYISHLDAILIAGAIDQPCSRLVENSGVCSTRPQVCTFCLAMHKKYSFNVSQIISDYPNNEATPCIFMPTNGTCFNLDDI